MPSGRLMAWRLVKLVHLRRVEPPRLHQVLIHQQTLFHAAVRVLELLCFFGPIHTSLISKAMVLLSGEIRVVKRSYPLSEGGNIGGLVLGRPSNYALKLTDQLKGSILLFLIG